MRINVYAEEILPQETEFVTKIVKTVTPVGQTEPVTFYGIRMYLDSPPSLHHSEDDDDRSAITFWVQWTKAKGNDFSKLGILFGSLLDEVGRAAGHERHSK